MGFLELSRGNRLWYKVAVHNSHRPHIHKTSDQVDYSIVGGFLPCRPAGPMARRPTTNREIAGSTPA